MKIIRSSAILNDVIFMETAERFILTTRSWYHSIPEYYINKADLGTGSVEHREIRWA